MYLFLYKLSVIVLLGD